MSGLFNHRSVFVIDIFKRIAVIMPGSYGILYIHN
ncbi:Imm7 family immunity protein [Leptospira noguchii]|nr:Imm7 family immunity protein [Leptospira noguchii]